MKAFPILTAILLNTVITLAAEKDSTSQGFRDSLIHLSGRMDGLNESYLETKSIVDKSSKLKFSGYLQGQWQLADSAGVPSMAGGNFPFNIANWHAGAASEPLDSLRFLDTLSARQRFQVRRARLKTTYDAGTSKFVLEIDVLPASVSIKDANVSLMEPWFKTFSATLGIMDRPFGFEVPYSSSSLETPERSRIAQTVFAGEKDLGVKLEVKPPEKMGLLQYLNLKGGFFAGMGGSTPNFNEVDNHLDFIGRAGFQAPFTALNFEVDGGFSAYLGKTLDRSDYAFTMGDSIAVTALVPRYVQVGVDVDTVLDTVRTAGVTMTVGNQDNLFDRKIYGVDAQLYYDIPVIGGMSMRGEYLWGKMPGTMNNNSPYNTPGFPLTPLFERKVEGWYLMLVQNIGRLFQAVVKYDVFDPNTQAKGSDIIRILPVELEATNHLQSLADLKFSTLGFGLNYFWDEHLRFTAYYDMVTNEKVNAANADTLYLGNTTQVPPSNPLAHYKNDLKDNVFTFRAQFRF